jgi:hypothetical protein
MIILLIWIELPYDWKWYIIEDPSVEDLDLLYKVHNKNTSIEYNDIDIENALDTIFFKVHYGEWEDCIIDKNKPIDKKVDMVFVCGDIR